MQTQAQDSDSNPEVMVESEDDADEQKPGPSLLGPRMEVEARKRHAEEDELPVFASTSSPPSRKILNRAEVVIVTPSKKRRIDWQP